MWGGVGGWWWAVVVGGWGGGRNGRKRAVFGMRVGGAPILLGGFGLFVISLGFRIGIHFFYGSFWWVSN